MTSPINCLARTILVVAAVAAILSSNGKAQTPGGAALSPEVTGAGKVTFRLPAPNAKMVQVAGDFTSKTNDLVKDDKGIWSFTTEALKPSSYQYWYIMDGLTMPDPANTYVRPASGVYKSQFDVPGAEMQWMAFRDVPHGTLTEHWYINRDNGTARRVVVYTPPGYGTSGQSYPVLYLLHGANDFERGWTQAGRANWIMDNLLAEGKTAPAIIVMPFGHGVSGSTGKLPEVRALQAAFGVTNAAAGGRGGQGGTSFMEKDLLNLVVPLIEREYRVLKDANHRAIVGYSMGGMQATAIGLNHPELFAYVAGMSGNTATNGLNKALAEPENTNRNFKLIWLGCGTDDTAINGGRALHRALSARNIRHEWTESPGYRHDYQIWRIYLKDILPKLFKD